MARSLSLRTSVTPRTGRAVRSGAQEANMARCVLRFVAPGFVLLAISNIDPAVAQKTGGILRQYIIDSPAIM